jgi:hypothetical protein
MNTTDPMATVRQYIDEVTKSGAISTVALRKLPERWRIAAWAWAKGSRA